MHMSSNDLSSQHFCTFSHGSSQYGLCLKGCITVVACHEQLKEGNLTLVGPVGQCLLPKVTSTLDFLAFLPSELSRRTCEA